MYGYLGIYGYLWIIRPTFNYDTQFSTANPKMTGLLLKLDYSLGPTF